MVSMPTLASVAPLVPPRMIRSAGMSMNDAGLVPSIIAPIRMPGTATPMPMPVAGFIGPFIGHSPTTFISFHQRSTCNAPARGLGGRGRERASGSWLAGHDPLE